MNFYAKKSNQVAALGRFRHDHARRTSLLFGIKGELQRKEELISYERAFKMLENYIYIAGTIAPFSSY